MDWGIPGIIPLGNPTIGTKFKVAFHSETRRWQEEIDLTHELARLLESHGHSTALHNGCVIIRSCGLKLKPGLVNHIPLDDGKGTSSITTIETSHSSVFPSVFEYQHAQAASMRESVQNGFSDWIKFDLPVYLDCLRIKAEHCICIESPYPTPDGKTRWRRVLLGPTKFSTLAPPDESACAGHGPGCDCCGFTQLFEILKPMMEANGFCAIRIFTVLDPPENPGSDCRVNGEDFDVGAAALLEYAKQRNRGYFEFRKQLILIQDWYDRPEDSQLKSSP